MIENAEYTRCEIELAARREMIVKLEDFMRRRSKIELVVRRQEYQHAPGLREACDILFGEQAEARLREYLETADGTRTAALRHARPGNGSSGLGGRSAGH